MHVLTLLIPISALTTHGWKRENGELGIQWDSPKNLTKSKERVEYVLSGCKCKTGCTNKRCKCFKQERRCGPGCKCVNCMNTLSNHLLDVHDLVLSEQCHSNSEDDYVETDCEEDEETNKIMNTYTSSHTHTHTHPHTHTYTSTHTHTHHTHTHTHILTHTYTHTEERPWTY